MKERERGFCVVEPALYYPIARSQPLSVSLLSCLSLFLSSCSLEWPSAVKARRYLMPSLKNSVCVAGSSLKWIPTLVLVFSARSVTYSISQLKLCHGHCTASNWKFMADWFRPMVINFSLHPYLCSVVILGEGVLMHFRFASHIHTIASEIVQTR